MMAPVGKLLLLSSLLLLGCGEGEGTGEGDGDVLVGAALPWYSCSKSAEVACRSASKLR